MWLAFGLGVFVGTLFGIFLIGVLSAGSLQDVQKGRDTPK